MTRPTLSPDHRKLLATLVDEKGEAAIGDLLGVSASVVVRALAGRPLRRVSVTALVGSLAGLDSRKGSEAA